MGTTFPKKEARQRAHGEACEHTRADETAEGDQPFGPQLAVVISRISRSLSDPAQEDSVVLCLPPSRDSYPAARARERPLQHTLHGLLHGHASLVPPDQPHDQGRGRHD
eukprot:5583579-Prymnesium_polylepis.1